MKCPKCKNPQLLVEDLGNGHTKVRCSKCGFHEVRDAEGRKLLLDTRDERDPLLS